MIYFLIYLFLEVIVTVEVATRIGGMATFLEIVISALLGILVLFNFRRTLGENLLALQLQKIDLKGFTQLNFMALFGALLLILPGFLSDFIGILMQAGVFASLFVNRFSSKYQKPTQQKDDHVIDAEIITDSTPLP